MSMHSIIFIIFLFPYNALSYDYEGEGCREKIREHGACCVWIGDDLTVLVPESQDTFKSLVLPFNEKLLMCQKINSMRGA